MGAYPAFTSVARLGSAQVTTANTNRDGTGTIADVLTGVAAGTRIDTIRMQAISSTTAGMLRLFIYDGTNTRLYKEIPVLAVTPSATLPAWGETLSSALNPDILPIILPSASAKLQASTEKTETFNIFAEGGDLT